MSDAYVCACKFTRNYFIQKYNMHVEFNNYLDENTVSILQSKGATNEEINKILATLQEEQQRRRYLGVESVERGKCIKKTYTPRHPYLYDFKPEFLDPKFVEIVNFAKSPTATSESVISMTETCAEKVWRFPVFTKEFCNDFVKEMCHFEAHDAPKGRPNTMNNYGILLNELGFDERFLDIFRQKYLAPIAKLLLPEWVGTGLDSHKAFTVKYKCGEDLHLSYHFDNAEVTINICLGKYFEEGSLYFGNMRTEQNNLLHTTRVEHRVGYGILHRGQHKHGAMEISGENSERHNLIVWMRASSIRNMLCPMCGCKPVLVQQPKWGDGFTIDEEINTMQMCAI